MRLHDPMDGSAEDYWQIAKSSKGKAATTKAVKAFVSEFDDRLENHISEPAILEVFDEIDIVADSDSSVNKSLLTCSKGMRHNGMRAVMIGQSPSVGKKGLEWADLDNFNCVYFGTSIYTAIDKTPALQSKKESLRKDYEKLKDFCEKQNEELGLEGWNEYRVGLLVTQDKPYFFELPNADSIVCDWSTLEQTTTASESKVLGSKADLECQHLNSSVRKTYRDKEENPVRRNRKCKDCGASFTEYL
ncbi:MAG: hypothetical protein LH679_12475 [Cyanobacteria bacterium CAN_BIN43]|nr:hypothetical protein [Cyanobacteria bacterium CAN_BIN43]